MTLSSYYVHLHADTSPEVDHALAIGLGVGIPAFVIIIGVAIAVVIVINRDKICP